MQDLDFIEKHFVSLLGPVVSPLVSESFPARPEEYVREMSSNVGAVLTSFESAVKRSGAENKGEFVLYPQFTILLADLSATGSHAGMYGVIKAVVDAIDEKRFALQDEIYWMNVLGWRFVARRGDLWEYVIRAELSPKLARNRSVT